METAIGIQPIVDENLKVYGYEILFRGKFKDGKFNDIVATFHNLNMILNHYDLQSIIMDKKGFINVNEEILKNDILCLLNPEKFVLEVLETTDISQVVKEIKGFKEKGFTIAIDDFLATEENFNRYEKCIELFDIVKIDVLDSDYLWLSKNVDKFGNKLLLAEKVEDKETFEKYKDIGFKLFQGYFFAKPEVRKRKIAVSSKITVLRLLAKKDFEEIEEGIKSDPRLAVNLLKFVNSAFFARKSKIDTVRKAIMSLGVVNVKRWLLLSLYISDVSDITEDSLVDLVRRRSFLMSLLARRLKLDEEKAFLIGALSLIEVITDEKLEDILKLINADEDVQKALLKEEGIYGKLLKVSKLVEKNEPVGNLLQEIGISKEEFEDIYVESLKSKLF